MDNRQAHIRNFSIIAHIDHGKSTLADRLIEMTGVLSKREMESQVLDNMEIEKERGITIKSQAVRMIYKAKDGQEYTFNLIDTPGHVDFNYEVSRSLAAVKKEIEDIIGIPAEDAPCISAKSGLNVDQVLERIVTDLPAPNGDVNAKTKCLIFDSYYDNYKGAVAHVRVVDGSVKVGDNIKLMATNKVFTVAEVRIFYTRIIYANK